MAERSPIPRATYRLQFHRHFRLADAVRLVPYLSALGISHIYASPLFQARPGSTHGYDVCDSGKGPRQFWFQLARPPVLHPQLVYQRPTP